ncbi:hypothetical protein AGMMS4957_19220 [Bacteroidia bacterium]|nr:hypothetical protein AGMMS4957_19220 [Bacteroidia bacterium]
MKRKFSLISVFLLTMAVRTAFAVPAVPWLIEKQLPDGSSVSFYLKGDEKVNWMESPDGYTLLYNNQKEIVYAEQDNYGDLVPSSIAYAASGGLRAAAKELPFKKGLRYSKNQVAALQQIWEIGNPSPSLRATASSEVKGNKKALCLLVGFPDRPFKKTKAQFENLMNQVGYSAGTAHGSVKDFYRENSYGQMDLTITVAGPFTATNAAATYADKSGSAPRTLAREILTKANATVDFSEFAYLGKVETFHFIYAGFGAEAGSPEDEYIWAHKATITPIKLDGVTISDYSCSPELRGTSGTTITAIGAICHELCHVFGAPDYYDTDAEEGEKYSGAGQWDLMASGNWNRSGDVPAHINMYQKILFGWVNPIELTDNQTISNMPNSATNARAYTYTAHTNGELYVLENRQQTGFDAYIPGHGLLIWHVHSKALGGAIGNNKVNATHPQQFYPVVASSTTAIPNKSPDSYGDINSAGTPFPGSSRKTNFSDFSIPQAFSWTGLTGIGKALSDISETANGQISFKFALQVGIYPVSNLTAASNGSTATLSWTAPTGNKQTGYKIYRDGVLQETLPATTRSFSQMLDYNGKYEYTVSALYDYAESEPRSVSVAIVGGTSMYANPPRNLEIFNSNNTVNLTWLPPEVHPVATLAHAADKVERAYSLPTDEIEIASRFVPEDLVEYPGYELDAIGYGVLDNPKINLIYRDKPSMTFTLCVWQGGGGNKPETLIYEQNVPDNVTHFSAGWHSIALEQPVPLDNFNDLWIGFRAKKKPSLGSLDIYCIPCDTTGPFISGKGNCLFYGDEWRVFTDDDEKEINVSWSLRAAIKPISSVESYTVSRDAVELPLVAAEQTEFIDRNVPSGNYNYSVVANYATIKSAPVWGNISLNASGIAVVLDDEMIQKISVYDFSGRLIYANHAVNAIWQTVRNRLPAYPCIVQMVTQQGVVKTVKHLRATPSRR